MLHPTLKEALAVHEAFRRLGFPAADIFVSLIEQNTMVVFVKQGDKESFSVSCGTYDDPDWKEKWIEAAQLWNERMTNVERCAIWEGSRVSRQAIPLVTGLLKKGYRVAKPGPS